MPNYLNQIESDLYKLYSITNGSGEVVEMVTELKEKYQKAEAFDRIAEQRKGTGVITLGHYAWHIIRDYESGESDAKK